MSKDRCFITVFTPTYNRAELLNRLYMSLVKQSFNDFEWLIVDDGSTDNTESLVNNWINEQKITIRYFKQINGGKHRAINKGFDLAKGWLFFIVDSDDYLVDRALIILHDKYVYAKEKYNISGVAARRIYSNGTIVGSDNFTEILSNSIDIRYNYKVTGDLVEVFELDVLKGCLFPEFQNEMFCPEALMWNRLAINNKLLFFNEGVYVTEYLDGGLSDNIIKIRMLSPKSSMLHYGELEKYEIPFLQKVKANVNYWRFSFNDPNSIVFKFKHVSTFNSLIGLPAGYLIYLKDKMQLK
jgi:glycosyltransferase involved in cell wall biosynthesis